MKNRTLKILALTCTCLIFQGNRLFAQDTTGAVKWNLQTCLGYAVKNNLQLNTLRLSQQTSQQEYLLSRAGLLPSLNASASQYLTHSNELTAGGTYKSALPASGSYGLTSSWTLYQGGYLRNDIKQKNLEIESAGLSLKESENDITLQITQYYLNALLDKESIIYQQNVVSTSAAQVKQAANRLAAGSIARKDLGQLKAQLANDEYALITAENAQRQDLIGLKQLLQLPSLIQFDIIRPDTIISTLQVASLTSVLDIALQSRPEVKNSELGIGISRISLAKARSAYLPTLTAAGSASSSYLGGSPGYFTQLNHGFFQQAGLLLALPVYSRRLTRTSIEEAKIGITQAELTNKATRTNLSLTVEKAYINVISAENQFKAASEAFKYNTETYRVANEQLRLGVFNMVEFLQQKSLYIQALQQYVQAKYNAALTIQIYNFYKGEPVSL